MILLKFRFSKIFLISLETNNKNTIPIKNQYFLTYKIFKNPRFSSKNHFPNLMKIYMFKPIKVYEKMKIFKNFSRIRKFHRKPVYEPQTDRETTHLTSKSRNQYILEPIILTPKILNISNPKLLNP